MAARKPLVLVNGQISQLSASDTLDAAVSEVDVVSVTNSNAGAVVIGNAVYVDGAGSVDLAQADAGATKKVLGLVREASIASAAAGEIQTNGILVATTTQWDAVAGTTGGLTPGASYYLSSASAGDLTETAPTTVGEYVVPVGVGVSTTEMYIDIDTDVAL